MKKKNINDFIMESNIIHNSFYTYDKSIYVNTKIPIIITCPDHGDFEKTPSHHLRGQGCQECKNDKLSKDRRISLNEIIQKSELTYPNNIYDYTNISYKNLHDIVEIKCIKHCLIFKQELNSHLNGHFGCPKCKKENYKYIEPSNKKTTEQFINDSNLTHEYKYDYSLVEYINNETKVKIICKKCNNIFIQRPNNHLSDNGCPKCNESKGEKEIRRILENNNISFISQKRFNDCRYKNPLPFDFYIPNINTCIEFDGIQHFKSFDYLGGEDGFKLRIKKDKIKNEYCKNNNIRLIRISYKDNINKKLINILIN